MSNFLSKFSQNGKAVMEEAQKVAERDNASLSSSHILMAITEVPGTLSHDILREFSINLDQIQLIFNFGTSKKSRREAGRISVEGRSVLKLAFTVAADFGHFGVDTEHLLIALLSSPNYASYQAIKKIGVEPEQIKKQILGIFEDLKEMDEMIKRQSVAPSTSEGEAYDGPPEVAAEDPFRQTPVTSRTFPRQKAKALEVFAQELVTKARKKEIDPVIGRTNEVKRSIQILLRRSKNNPVLIGEPGVGKTAVVEGLSQKIAAGEVPRQLTGKKIYQLDLGLLVAGTMYRGQFEERLKKVLGEIASDKNAILFIDEIHTIVGTGSAEGSLDAANILKPALTRGKMQLIGATTAEEYRKYIEKDAALERRLQPITVEEPTIDETIEILKGIAPLYEKHHGIKFSSDAPSAAANLSAKYISDRFLPDKAIDLLDEAAAEKSALGGSDSELKKTVQAADRLKVLEQEKERLIEREDFEKAAKTKKEEMKLRAFLESSLDRGKKTRFAPVVVSEKDIIGLVSQITGVPLGELNEQETKRYLEIEKRLSGKVIGQEEAVGEVAKSLRRRRAGITQESRPLGSFVFLGPSGVGKTKLAQILAQEMFGPKSLVRIDMSEFMEKHTVSRLLGAPPGYVGYGETGKLTEQVRKKPHSVVLFDEIEKAHPEIFNILLQLLDFGELTDSRGVRVNFKNTVVILTSNIGIDEYNELKKIGFEAKEELGQGLSGERVIERLKEIFRPELVNRLDKIIVFNPLSKGALEAIAKQKLEELKGNLGKLGVQVSFARSVISHLLEGSHETLYGARPLIKTIEDEVEGAISDWILSKEIDKKSPFLIEFQRGRIRLKKRN